MHESSRIYKGIFFGLVIVVTLLVLGATALIVFSTDRLTSPDDQMAFVIMMIALLFSYGILTIIGVLVFRDATKQGMNPWMWVTIAVFVPNAIGIIIYLLVRSNERKKMRCHSCGNEVQSDFAKCPHCGTDLKMLCPGCNKPVDSVWNICPYCSHALKE
jgi:cytochrome bd-type quinol oxidase subunit 2